MPSDRFIAYYCATAGRKGCKLQDVEMQRSAVMSFLNRHHGTLLERHTERGGRGKQRPALADALAACQAHQAALVVADPDHLEGDNGFLEEVSRAGVECWAVEIVPAHGSTKAKPLWPGGRAPRACH